MHHSTYFIILKYSLVSEKVLRIYRNAAGIAEILRKAPFYYQGSGYFRKRSSVSWELREFLGSRSSRIGGEALLEALVHKLLCCQLKKTNIIRSRQQSKS